MVHISSFIGVAAVLSFVAALPRPDSSINEPAVSAPNGTPVTDTSVPVATSVSSMGGSAVSSPMPSDSSSTSGSMDSSSTSSPMDSSSSGSGSSSYGSGSSYGGSMSSYGSGSSNSNSDGYNSCVQQCVANYGSMSSSNIPSTTTSSGGSDSSMSSSSDSSSSSGSGATHTVIVAPTQGVLRFVPFALNASVGDTVKFMWGADNHTVTKSSELTPCNKTSDNPFSSGEQNLGFTFEQVVNDTTPTFFYCGTPTHCEKGMFGIINPPNALGAPTSVSGMMQSLLVSNPDLSAYNDFTEKQTFGKGPVNEWGSNIDMASLPDWSRQYVAQNVLYTRNLVANNPDVLQADGSINVGAAGSNPLMLPQDVSAYLSSAIPSAPASTPAATSAVAPTSAPASPGSNNGASSMSSPKIVVGLIAALATFLAL